MDRCTFIICGATGDLTKRKLIPAIYKLLKKGRIEKFAFIGLGLEHVDVHTVLEEGRPFIRDLDPDIWKKFESCSYYFPFNFYHSDAYEQFKINLFEIEKKHETCGNRLFYLATMPEHFFIITENLAASGIVHLAESYTIAANEAWSRIVYEKPFGYDLVSARTINDAIAHVFSEQQIYRIDHYLGKELVANISLVRFTNRIFEPLWSNKHIDSVQIILSEQIGIEGRGKFFDSVGIVKDMLQSHMLQMLALVGMEAPKEFSAQYIRDAKAEVLKHVVFNKAIFGQYDRYRKEKDVNPESMTETFATVSLGINNHRWKGVPFYLKVGKFLDKKDTSIHIKFKMEKCLLTHNCPTDSNYLTIKIQPDEGFYLELNAKIPEKLYEIVPVKMAFSHVRSFGPNTPEAYETLLSDVLRGDQSVFLRSDEIEYSWEIVEKILADKTELFFYSRGSSGPKELDSFSLGDEIRWRS